MTTVGMTKVALLRRLVYLKIPSVYDRNLRKSTLIARTGLSTFPNFSEMVSFVALLLMLSFDGRTNRVYIRRPLYEQSHRRTSVRQTMLHIGKLSREESCCCTYCTVLITPKSTALNLLSHCFVSLHFIFYPEDIIFLTRSSTSGVPQAGLTTTPPSQSSLREVPTVVFLYKSLPVYS